MNAVNKAIVSFIRAILSIGQMEMESIWVKMKIGWLLKIFCNHQIFTTKIGVKI